jgi:hypothetical protein
VGVGELGGWGWGGWGGWGFERRGPRGCLGPHWIVECGSVETREIRIVGSVEGHVGNVGYVAEQVPVVRVGLGGLEINVLDLVSALFHFFCQEIRSFR